MITNTKVSHDDVYENVEILKQNYVEDVISKCETLSNSVLYKYSSSNKTKIIQELCRVIHSMKGTSAMYGFSMVSAICHRFEDFLMNNGVVDNMDDERVISRILQYLDVINSSAFLERHDIHV